MNNSISDLVTGGKPIQFEVTFENKSLYMLGAVLVISAIIIVGFIRITKKAS